MTNKEKKDWLSVKYPLTVVCDRYDGTYSGAKWLAFPLDYDKIPSDVDASDPECAQFWKNYKEPVGRGAYANDAVKDLIEQMWISEPEESEDERVRKGLINFLRSPFIKENLTDEKVAPWIAYLEKQKEQKPAEYLNKDKVYAIMAKLTNLSYSQLIPINSDEFKKLHEITCDVRSLLDYPIEQKPAEWSEEFGKEVESVHKRYPEVSFAKLTRIAYHFAKWADKYKSTEWSKGGFARSY